MTQAHQQAKFRWTENLTCRFIQLRKENGKLFTGRKYSAQAGWEYILQQMREEFPGAMAGVHYRVLKKKWSNLLQQYKELKNPVHGDRNKADDVCWPFYNAIDELVGQAAGTPSNEEYIDPQEFLCVSVTPEEATTSSSDTLPAPSNPEIEGARGSAFLTGTRLLSSPPNPDRSIRIKSLSRNEQTSPRISGDYEKRKRSSPSSSSSSSSSSRARDLPIEGARSPVGDWRKDSPRVRSCDEVVDSGQNKGQAARNEDEERPRKSRRSGHGVPCHENHESQIHRRIDQIFEYTKRRDRENRSIMMRIMHAVESIAAKL